MIKYIDLFSGIGGFRLAFDSVGGKCVFSADTDKHACETYNSNFGVYPLFDVSKLDASSIPDFNILCAGFPCQPFSIAGDRKGFGDTRGTLFFDIERILKNKQPEAFLLENVKGLENHDGGNTLKVILNTLENTLNYKVYHKVINSRDYGVPQNRERIYIIGFKNQKIEFVFPDKLDNNLDLSDVLDSDLSGSEITQIAKFNVLKNLRRHKKYDEIKDNKLLLAYEIRKSRCTFRYDNIAPTLTAKMGTGGNNVPVLVNQMRKLTTKECLRIQGFPDSFKIKTNNAQSYKQIGNSVTVPVIKLLAENIVKSIA